MEKVLSRTNNNYTIRGATLIHGMTRALSRIPSYPRQFTPASGVAEYSEICRRVLRRLICISLRPQRSI